jgi:hypothetical protein
MIKWEWRFMVMGKVEKLENEVQQLNPDELAAFRDWFRRYDSDEWDKEIESDVSAGRLDKLAEEAIAAHKAGKTREI